jgi:hypothetical protein
MSLTLSKLVDGVAGMPDQAKRRISALIGAVVADSASLPLEWIYKDADMKDIVGDKNPEFWAESKCPFYTVPTGNLSCYGDEVATCLASLAAKEGKLELGAVQEAIIDKFGSPGSPYQVALAKRANKVYPVPGPWINGGVIKSLANMTDDLTPPGSADCQDNDGLAVSLPVFLLQLCPSESVDTANLLTTHKVATDHLILQTAILTNFLNQVEKPVQAAAEKCSKELPDLALEVEAVVTAVEAGGDVTQLVAQFGKACGLPGSFQGSLVSLLLCDDYVTAVRENILAGGDCNARSLLIGACLGARLGVEGIPMDWIQKVTGIQEFLQNAVKVYASSDK